MKVRKYYATSYLGLGIGLELFQQTDNDTVSNLVYVKLWFWHWIVNIDICYDPLLKQVKAVLAWLREMWFVHWFVVPYLHRYRLQANLKVRLLTGLFVGLMVYGITGVLFGKNVEGLVFCSLGCVVDLYRTWFIKRLYYGE